MLQVPPFGRHIVVVEVVLVDVEVVLVDVEVVGVVVEVLVEVLVDVEVVLLVVVLVKQLAHLPRQSQGWFSRWRRRSRLLTQRVSALA